MSEIPATINHGSPAGFELGCRSAGGCPNHGSAEWLTCKEAATARRSDYSLGKLPLDAPVARKALEFPKPSRRSPAPAASAPVEHVPDEPTTAARNQVAEQITPPATPTTRGARAEQQPKPRARVTTQRAARPATERAPRPAPRASTPTQPRPARPAKTPRQPVHGTVYGWRRGCRTDHECPNVAAGGRSCSEAKREYYADYRASRRAGGGPPIKHGTTSGYQSGCHDRAACPGGPDGVSCADASLAAERRRRRARGIPERAPVVDAAPAIAHIATLRAAGMPITEIITRSGVSRTAIRALIYGRDDYTPSGPGPRHGEIPAHIEKGKADRILAVQPPRTVQLRSEPRRLQVAS